ncbi:phosphoribosyltransferase family protein [Flavobacteriaceae bacterium]|jgi:pyrimidine operon attenuation protein/uracil phosphoribosyltransferase|nr:phosphoribosyltransferase family protein [Flavobacteriaceae bacterium]MDA8904553.1 phosphoribosyltransferase family protein [Flavobacteriaceae bacterium]MDB4212898.1 phosphoribosyltransferase family protein [Flavobacteriaceae bacterium]MDC0552187.1 phosphoribosyltransferase family protein [Flavobacteriaceae bacterium]MDC0623409.1 phosphoribosyltransferase family protein [Flavobacteriaceae bacterium]|tara:strand:+ start:718 stop:1215 length:498 start_codon:yes stop_codon:yes gene_type:complete
MKKNIILNNEQINQKIARIAHQIIESNIDEKEIIIAGIEKNGFIIASKLKQNLSNISDIKITTCSVKINKKNPLDEVTTSISKDYYFNKSLVLVDDVLNSGATLIYAVKHFLNTEIKQFKTAVLINRNHKKYPVKADFKGISLSTTTISHVKVRFTNNKAEAFLN